MATLVLIFTIFNDKSILSRIILAGESKIIGNGYIYLYVNYNKQVNKYFKQQGVI